MPKRPKTPSPSRDEPKYFTVVHPWPGHLDLSLPGDGKQMCMWLAAACGTSDPILSFFYRPDSPGLCIIEVEKKWAEENARLLLGCHSWQYFLYDTSDTANNATSVFYSHYTRNRDVQKMGWKSVDPEDTWFGSPEDRAETFVSPYPRSTWCSPPAHDATGHSFCRTLPVSLFPEGSSGNAGPLPVGSRAWIEKRANVPALITLKESRPTSEPIFSPNYDEYFGPVGGIVESNEPIEVTEDLWGDTEVNETTELISDLALASWDDTVEDFDVHSLCPHHGQTCKKGLCEWRATYEKKKEREDGYPTGPSNTKNYRYGSNTKKNNNRGRRRSPNGSNRSGTQTPLSPTAPNPTTQLPSARGAARGRPPPPPVSAWGRGPPPTLSPTRMNQPSTSTPGQGNGTGRGGQPAWAPSRGRRPT